MPESTLSDAELQALLDATESAANAWMRGDAGPYLDLTSRSDDFTIMGPFGGPARRGYEAYSQGAPIGARLFQDGASKLRLAASYASGDLAVLVLEEEQSGRVGGADTQPWRLRVTQVYRREKEGWRVVHRHADPLMKMRSVADAAALARA
jgi:ketosteroid isomerase-like protein